MAVRKSERLLSSISSPSPSTSTSKKKLSRSTDESKEDGVVKSHAFDVQDFRDDPDRLQGMTLQQLRTVSRNFGVPTKGSKHELLLALKCFLDDEEDEHLSSEVGLMDPEVTASRTSGEDHAQNLNLVSEISGSQQKKRRKLLSIDRTNVETNQTIVETKKSLSGSSDRVAVAKSSRTQRKTSISGKEDDGSNAGVELSVNHTEPWTMLAHKKPQKGWIPYNPRIMRPPPLADGAASMKLMSWNVNGLRALLKLEGFSALELAQRENFDVLCLQETKLQEKDVEDIRKRLVEGYDNSFWTCSISKLGYSGTAIISRIKPLSVRYGLGITDHDTEGRLVTVEFETFYLLSGYVPNSGDGLKRLTYRITEWDPSLSTYMKELEKSKPVILTGDLNCAHEEIDIYNPAGNRRSAGFTIEERQSFETNFLSKGYVDTFRRQHPDVVGYTYWGYRHGGRVHNKGWRLDYFLVSESIADKVHDSYILPDVMGSDHCPIGLVLKL